MRERVTSGILRRALRVQRSAVVLCALLFLVCVQARAQVCSLPGNDGPGGSLSVVINTYYPGTATANAGATSITLGAARTGGALTPIATGDLLLVIQMQDAAINSNNTNAYGANNATGSGYTALNNSGRFEYVQATNSVGRAAAR